MILPLVKYLEAHGVRIEYGMDVKNVIIKDDGGRKIAKQIVYIEDGKQQTIDLIEDDLVFITNGCCTGNHRFLQDFVSAMQILMKDMIKSV